jgi:hypothetical protein
VAKAAIVAVGVNWRGHGICRRCSGQPRIPGQLNRVLTAPEDLIISSRRRSAQGSLERALPRREGVSKMLRGSTWLDQLSTTLGTVVYLTVQSPLVFIALKHVILFHKPLSPRIGVMGKSDQPPSVTEKTVLASTKPCAG